MNAEYLLDAVGLLDDDLIREAETYVPRRERINYRAWLGLAACLAVVAALGYGMTHLRMGGGAAAPSGGAAGAPAASNGSIAPAPSAPAPGESLGGGPSGDMPNESESSAPVGSEADYCAAIMVDGTLYWSTGTPVPVEPTEEAIRTVTGYTDTVPEEDGQINFDQSLTTQYAMTDMGLVVLMDNEWVLFDPVPPWEQ